ncbi:MAG: RNA-binding S4 domain-containing protein [Rhodospirillaceae bacterium]|nr:RNA-binding S4 domain-containing protein [Rhodospirillaceae bacterium]
MSAGAFTPPAEKAAALKPAVVHIDKWLWFARFGKTRSVAQKLIERGQVTINGAKVRKTGAPVRIGDLIAVVLGRVKRVMTVRGLGERRGSAEVARLLYGEAAPVEKLTSENAALPLYKPLLVRARGAGRPTKKDQRVIAKEFGDRWGDES